MKKLLDVWEGGTKKLFDVFFHALQVKMLLNFTYLGLEEYCRCHYDDAAPDDDDKDRVCLFISI